MRDNRPDHRLDRREVLRRLHRIAGQLRAVAEHLKQLAEDLDAMVDTQLPPVGPLGPFTGPLSGPPASPTP